MQKLFAREVPMKEQLRKNEREINKQGRDLDRERAALERQEKQLVIEIKKMAQQGNEKAAKTLAKSLIQTRAQKDKLLNTKVQMKSINTQMKTMATTQKVTQAMGTATQIMGKMNAQINPAQTQKMMMEFARQNEMMEMKDEMVNDALDSALGGEDEDAEVDAAMNEVFDSIGVDLSAQLNAQRAPSGGVRRQTAQTNDVDDLAARLDALKVTHAS